jgi:hypothetical protein
MSPCRPSNRYPRTKRPPDEGSPGVRYSFTGVPATRVPPGPVCASGALLFDPVTMSPWPGAPALTSMV